MLSFSQTKMNTKIYSFGKNAFSWVASATLAVTTGLLSIVPVFAATEVVQNVRTIPYNSAAMIEWDAPAAAVSSYEVSYGLFSVAEGLADQYDKDATVDGSETSVLLEDLTNGVRYYVAIKAMYSDGGQSATFSEEVTATPSSVYESAPSSGEDNGANPAAEAADGLIVESAEALTKNLVEIQFSEDVLLPELFPELAFTARERDDESVILGVEGVAYKVENEGEEGEETMEDTVWITLTDDMEDGVEYTITVGAAILSQSDESPIESGIADFANFTGTSRTEILAEDEGSEEDPDSFILEPEEGDDTPEEVVPTEPEADTTAPENATNFSITSVARTADYILNMKWTKSSSDDVNHQDIYRSEDKGANWGDAVELAKEVEKYNSFEKVGEQDVELSYKLTATDEAGNENSGIIQSIRLPKLADTGAPLALIGLGTSFSWFGIRRFRKRKF